MTTATESGGRVESMTCSVAEAAVLLGVSTWTVYELIREGKLRPSPFSTKPGCRKRIPKSAIIKLVEGEA